MHEAAAVSEYYKNALLFLVTAGVIVPLFRRLRVSPVIGFLVAGVAVGPFGLGRLAHNQHWLAYVSIANADEIGEVAELGVVFLLFMIGLELSFERLMRMRRILFGLGSVQVVVSAVLIGAAAYGLHLGSRAAIVLGGALALSSTAIVIPVLADRKRLNSATGRSTFAVLLFQDLCVAPLLILVGALGDGAGGGPGSRLIATLAVALPAIALLIVAGRLVLRPLFQMVAGAGSTEFFMAACLLVVMGTAMITAASGLSMAIGAFIAGLLLAETEYRREIEVLIEPFQGLLLGLFFVSVGAGLDLSRLLSHPVEIVGIAVGLIVLKGLVVMAGAATFKVPHPVGREMALLLGPGGEFAFVMLNAAILAGAVPRESAEDAMVAVTLSMLAIPVLARLGEAATQAKRFDEAAFTHLAPPPDAAASRVMIVGYGRVGRLIGEMLVAHDVPFLAIDQDARLVAGMRDAGHAIYYGDATRPEFLRRAGLATARALVVTMDQPSSVEHVVSTARAERPSLTIVARARDASHASKLYELGVTDAVPETIEASLQLSEAVLVDIGVPTGLVIASIHDKRDTFRKLLQPAREGEVRAIRASSRQGKAG
ncbi:Kef-type potassium/proton antiporter, CPA2 family [Rhizobiales bacterium GAS191]|nr:Kef-type potassium/proton antiporter, CPA2 family [Rhizobiales bacterium GAS113]SEC02700.1 Kef-type potassium/proton antiporter, CPA2 family [Rhizobiales bacterium GAS191]SED16501.1 Kef-type potassium/proton antiporter, CPA2 family [Rhizobiales bacterium GAS188]